MLLERYREFLPITDRTPMLTLNEGNTPLVAAPRLAAALGVRELFLKYEYDLNRVQIPLLPDGYTISFPEGNLVQCQHDPHRTGTPLDIGAYLVNDLGCAAKLRQSFVPVGRSLASEALTDSYLVAGYPDSRIENVDECTLHSNGGVLIMATTEYTGITFHDKGPYDLYLTNRAKARTAKGERIDVPDLGGLSGSVVWQVAQPRAGIWTADDKLIPVGVQAAVSSGRYARVVRWAAVEVAVQAAILGRGGIAAPCAEP